MKAPERLSPSGKRLAPLCCVDSRAVDRKVCPRCQTETLLALTKPVGWSLWVRVKCSQSGCKFEALAYSTPEDKTRPFSQWYEEMP